MQAFFIPLGYDVWASVVNGYKDPNTPPTDTTEIRLNNNNSRARNAILCGLKKSVYTKVMYCASAKEMWDKLQTIYEGDEKVKRIKVTSL
jgi:hypothetical protein